MKDLLHFIILSTATTHNFFYIYLNEINLEANGSLFLLERKGE